MTPGDKVFLDTNVVLDHLADRQPFAEAAHRLFALAETSQVTLCVSALSFSNLSYLLGRVVGHDRTWTLLRLLVRLTRVTITGDAEVRAALAGSYPDFEDALQWLSAEAEGGVTVILTRNSADFASSPIPVMSPEKYLAGREVRPA